MGINLCGGQDAADCTIFRTVPQSVPRMFKAETDCAVGPRRGRRGGDKSRTPCRNLHAARGNSEEIPTAIPPHARGQAQERPRAE